MIRTSMIAALSQARPCKGCGERIGKGQPAVLVSKRSPKYYLYPADTTAATLRFDVAWMEAGL